MPKKDYQKLLSKDPIGAFNKIKVNYGRYFKTMYRLKDVDLNNRKNVKLLNGDSLLKEPYIEILPEYKNCVDGEGNILSMEAVAEKLTKAFAEDDAKDFIENSEFSISEICYKVGFSSPSYFTKCFKLQYGLLPKEIRDNKGE